MAFRVMLMTSSRPPGGMKIAVLRTSGAAGLTDATSNSARVCAFTATPALTNTQATSSNTRLKRNAPQITIPNDDPYGFEGSSLNLLKNVLAEGVRVAP